MELTEEQIRQEAAECYARKVSRAERMSPAERFFAGAELFEQVCEITLLGIRHQYPSWTEDECFAELRRRVKNDEIISMTIA